MSEQREIRKLAEAVRLLFTAVDRMNWRLGVLADRLPPAMVVEAEPEAPSPQPSPAQEREREKAPPVDPLHGWTPDDVPDFVRGDEPRGPGLVEDAPFPEPPPAGESENLRRRKIHPPQLVAEVCQRWAAGQKPADIAAAVGLDAKAVANIAFRNGAKRPARSAAPEPQPTAVPSAMQAQLAASEARAAQAWNKRHGRARGKVVTAAIVDPTPRIVAAEAVAAETAPADADTILAWGRRNGAAFGALTAEALASINLARAKHQLTPFRLIANPIGRLAPNELDRMAASGWVPEAATRHAGPKISYDAGIFGAPAPR